ncbi:MULTISPECIES: winged helix-turn-helix domain-containing protein [Modicisalibacter]|uniref:Winged helix-turn-helix domain-containing protein n=1 Tax=Modicisalibacter tunisiensis TaxID=390637 RepID=A0ABS7X3L8_9GAMM|nr:MULTISPECIES: winged helix-turn-helix domain-containing protein [Modicisalibacter]MBZ9537867.1 winged helix-turn-helix domain-containing protein [Modicisalibacter tunisiensis]MBZ9568716.1 winged helix-turn-helix domain-containing protein [Modicisalibacter tunisiensis]
MTVSKTRSSFYRRLYVAYLIDSGLADSVPALTRATGMPRRTAQDTLAALADLDIVCDFEQAPGERHRTGRHVIRDWGPIDPGWVAQHHDHLRRVLGYPEPSTDAG